MNQDPKAPQPPKAGEEDEDKKSEEMARKRRELEERLKQDQYQRDDM